MTQNRGSARKTRQRVRMPATKFGHLQKRMKNGPKRVKPKTKK